MSMPAALAVEVAPNRPEVTRPAPVAVHGAGDEAALLRAIAVAPEDDAPRLVFADWLEENGRPDHAEHVRAGCELARVAEPEGGRDPFDKSPRWQALESRCEAATPRREGAWAVPADADVEFYRGLPAFLKCWPRDFVDRGRAWLDAAPTLHGLRLRPMGQSVRNARDLASAEHLGRITRLWLDTTRSTPVLEALLASPHLAAVTDLDLFGVYLRNTSALASAPGLTRLARLGLSDSRLGDDRLAGLLRSPVVDRLTYLGLQGSNVRDAGARALAGCPRLAGLATLDLENNRVGPAGLRALAASPHLGSLRYLKLAGNVLGPPAARELASACGLVGLRALDLSSNLVRDAGVRALLAAPWLAGLESLDLGYCDLTGESAEALAACDALANLRSLRLYDDALGDAGLLAVAGSPHLAGLRELAIDYEGATAKGLAAGTSRLGQLEVLRISVNNRQAALAACGLLGAAANLDLQANGLCDTGAAALAAMPELRDVVRLDLSFNRIRDRGAKALAESPHLYQLEELNLHCNDIGPAGFEALLSGLPRLTRLVVGSNPVKTEGLRRLASSPGAERLTSLGLWFISAGDAGVQALADSGHLANLRYLHLANNRVSPKAARRLIASPNLPRLASLTLGMGLSPEAFEELRREAARHGIGLGD